jgi:hypothetical protein
LQSPSFLLGTPVLLSSKLLRRVLAKLELSAEQTGGRPGSKWVHQASGRLQPFGTLHCMHGLFVFGEAITELELLAAPPPSLQRKGVARPLLHFPKTEAKPASSDPRMQPVAVRLEGVSARGVVGGGKA